MIVALCFKNLNCSKGIIIIIIIVVPREMAATFRSVIFCLPVCYPKI